MRFIFSFILILNAWVSHASDPLELKTLGLMFDRTMVECPEKIWPNYSWKDFRVILARPKSQTSFVWATDRDLEEVANEKLSVEVLGAYYHFLTYDEKPALSVNAEEARGQFLFELTVHEFFHDQGQSDWKNNPGQRGTYFPQSATPRINRRMLYDRLADYINSDLTDDKALAKAAFWYQKWKSENPEEELNSYDATEGAAEYVGKLASIIASNGCQVSKNQILASFKSEMNNEMGKEVLLGLDSEAYEIGTLAMMLLNLIKPDLAFTTDIEQNVNPLELLLAEVKPLADEIPGAVKAKYEEAVTAINISNKKNLGSIFKDFHQPSFIKIALPNNWMITNYSPRAFILNKEMPDLITMSMGAEVKFLSGLNSFSALENSVLVSADKLKSCKQEGSFIAVVPRNDLKINANRVELSTQVLKASFDLPKSYKENDEWMCLGE